MKKLFSLVTILFVFFILAACQGETITIVVVDDENILEEEVAFQEETSLFDLLKETFEVEYVETDHGPMILGVGPLTAEHEGSFILFEKNDESASAGVDAVNVSPGDTFRFSLGWYDDDARAVHETIRAFRKNHAADYIEKPQREAVLALAHLDELEGFVPPEDDAAEKDANALVNAIILRHIAEEASDDLYAALVDKAVLVHPYPDALIRIVFSLHEGSLGGEFSTKWLDDLRAQDLDEIDTDTLSMILLALTHETAPDGTEDLQDEVLSLIFANVYDNEFGHNAAGFAMATMALLAAGTDPRDEGLVHEGEHLLGHLLSFANEDGSFNYQDETDLDFSTPQAVLALVMMQKFLDGTEAPHPFELP